jgi:FkbM family methyltransferase
MFGLVIGNQVKTVKYLIIWLLLMINKKILSLLPHALRRSLGLNNPQNLIINGKIITIPIDIPGSFPNLFLKKSWKTGIIKHFSDFSPGTFIDVGANLGQTLIEFWIANNSSEDGVADQPNNSYIGFEPNKNCVEYLRSIIKINSFKDYSINPIGLFNESKTLSLYTQNDCDSCATVVEDLRPNRKYDVDEVSCQKFDDVFADMNIANISLIKIDVEGSELEVLQGMDSTIEKLRPPILCEVLFTDNKADLSFMELRNKNLIVLLLKWNYSAFQIIKNRDRSEVQKYQKISCFVSEFWSLKNMDLCDYLFLPIEQEQALLNFKYS